MSSLQILIESIVADLIKARFTADAYAAQYAELYRNDPVLSTLNVPTLNISNVSVDLRVAFDDSPIAEPENPSEEQTDAIKDAAEVLHGRMSTLESVTRKLTAARDRSTLARAVRTAAVRTASARINSTPGSRRAAVSREVAGLLDDRGVKLSASDRRTLSSELESFEVKVASAPKTAATLPKVIVGAESLAKVDPATVSSIRFTVDLSAARWTAIEGADGESDAVLTDR